MKLKDISNLIESTAKAQPNINTYYFGDIYSSLNTNQIEYSAIVVSQQQHNEDDYYRTYNLNIFFVDRLTSDESNRLDIQSYGIEVLQTIIKVLEDNGCIIANDNIQYQTFKENFESACAGVYCTVGIQVPLSDCGVDNLPFAIGDYVKYFPNDGELDINDDNDDVNAIYYNGDMIYPTEKYNVVLTLKDGSYEKDWYANGIIPDNTYSGRQDIVKVELLDGITEIGESAFKFCYNIKSITMTDSVKNIGKEAFRGTLTTTLRLTNSITKINDWVFADCCFTSITIPSGVTYIGECAFIDCKFSAITIPDSVTSIGHSAFEDDTKLVSIKIPCSVTSLGTSVFEGCTSLTSVTLPDSYTEIPSHFFEGCTSLESITLPSSITNIAVSVFEGCTSLTSITIPDGVNAIYNSGFKNCTALTSINYNNTMEKWNSIIKVGKWHQNVPATVVHCTDGDVDIS